MASVLQKLYDGYTFLFEDLADSRVKSFFLMSSPFPLLCILGFYLYFVLKLGPQLMKNRPPFDLEKILVLYNFAQILACLYLVTQGIKYTLFTYSLVCEPVDYSNNELPLIVVKLTWMYFMLKVIDLLDTVFFVLRKKTSQVSLLHVYHHTGMCIFIWIGTKYVAGGHSIFLGFLNCAVHAVMYFYYLLSAWNREYKKNVWWKKHITQLQIIQFMVLAVYFGQILVQPNCHYPKWAAWFLMPQDILMTFLFVKFYIKTYIKSQGKLKLKHNSLYTEKSESNGCKKSASEFCYQIANPTNHCVDTVVHR